MLEKLQKANPHIKIYSVRDREFNLFGSVCDGFDASALVKAAIEGVKMPETGTNYLEALDCLDTHPDAAKVRDLFAGQTDAQFGICWGHNQFLDALEYHNSSEIIIAATAAVLLLADRRDVKNGRLDTNTVKAFLLEKGEIVEVYATSLHYAPCKAEANFSCIIVLPRGANTPLKAGEKPASYLFAKNKWLLAHEDNKGLVDQGVFPGLYGTNWKINPV